MMKRTQIYLDESTDQQLRQHATLEHRSAAAIVREALQTYFTQAREAVPATDPIRSLAGRFHGLPSDAAVNHDEDLYGPESARRGRRPE